ncbi:MAG: VWA domain-containing protein, partial [Desulfofundulus sp.]
ALGAVLVKKATDRQIYNLAFDRFFVTPEEKKKQRILRKKLEEDEEQRLAEARQKLNEALSPWFTELNFNSDEIRTFARMPAGEQKRLTEIIRQMHGNPVNDPGRLVARVMQSALNYWRYYLLKTQGGKARQQLEAELTGETEMDDVIAGVAADFYRDPDDQLLHQDMQQVADSDLEKFTSILERLSRRLANRLSRRYRKSNRRQKLDMRRTIRRNIAFGGSPLKLCYRSRRRQRPRLLLICDVSASMARYARFILQFIYGLSSAARDIESFVFSDDLERITPYFHRNEGFVPVMTKLINSSRQWGKTTNFNASLKTFHRHWRHLLTGDTLVVIVSDTKTIAPQEAARELAALRERVREILWLNPVPRKQWSCLPGIAAFLPYVNMFECYTLHHLEAILDRQMMSIS